MNPATWFEMPATDLSRAKAFYEQVFGLELGLMEMGPTTMAMFPSDPTLPNAGGALVKGEDYTPNATGTTVYFAVTDIDGTLAKVAGAGGTIALPKMGIGEFGAIGLFIDTEGNRVGLHSME
jgi:predicted enzyme related to lactoylglutathione lyase